jgi:Alpha amylase, catalytic domain
MPSDASSSSTLTSPKSAKPVPSAPFPLRVNPHLYEINTWAWLEEVGARLGRNVKLGDVPDAEWDRLAERGFDIIWLMGMWQRSAAGRSLALQPEMGEGYSRALPGWRTEDVVGSPYSVAAYEPDPRIGTWADLDLVREKLHARKIALFLDFVGNHTALDHLWVTQHPEFYVQGTQKDFEQDPSIFFRSETPKGTFYIALARDPYFPPWRDLAQLNHFSPEMRAAQLKDLSVIAEHCDGVRCDMAMLQLNEIFARTWSRFLGGTTAPATEFWAAAKAALPNLILLAESYWGTEEQLLKLGFSFAYDKETYDAVRDLNVAAVRNRLAMPIEMQQHFARFLENHDEQRCAVVFGGSRLQALGTLMSTLPGMRFYDHGELEGRKIHLPIQLRTAAPEQPDPASMAFFDKILRATNEDVFHAGKWRVLGVTPEGDPGYENLVAFEWQLGKVCKLIVVNLSSNATQGRVPLGDRASASGQYVFYDQLNDARYLRGGEELSRVGLFVRLEPFHAHLFDITPE